MKITLIIPVYNEEETILKLEEIKLETLVDLSLKYPLAWSSTLVEGYGVDNTTKIIDQWCKFNSQFSILELKKYGARIGNIFRYFNNRFT